MLLILYIVQAICNQTLPPGTPIQLEQPEAIKSLYHSPGYKKNQLVLCKNYVLQW